MKMYHKYLSLILVMSISFSSYAAVEPNGAAPQGAQNQNGDENNTTWYEEAIKILSPDVSTDFLLGGSLKLKYAGIPAFGLWATYKAYLLYTLPIDIEAMETRLLRLESATNGMIAQRHAKMDTVRSSKYAEALWHLSDQLLELRSEISIPEFKAFDDTTQKAMLDKIDSLTKRIDLMTKMKVAAVAA